MTLFATPAATVDSHLETALDKAKTFTNKAKFLAWFQSYIEEDHPLALARSLASEEHGEVYRAALTRISATKAQINQLLYQCRKAHFAHIQPHIVTSFVEGAVLVCSWGYEQTNVDFYVIVKKTPHTVQMLPLKAITTPTGDMTGESVANMTNDAIIHKHDPTRHKINDSNWIRIESYSSASLWTGKKMYTSSYA